MWQFRRVGEFAKLPHAMGGLCLDMRYGIGSIGTHASIFATNARGRIGKWQLDNRYWGEKGAFRRHDKKYFPCIIFAWTTRARLHWATSKDGLGRICRQRLSKFRIVALWIIASKH